METLGYVIKNFIEVINGRIVKQESLQMNILTKTIKPSRSCSYLNNLLSQMKEDVKKAYNNYLHIEKRDTVVIIKFNYFIRNTDMDLNKNKAIFYYQIDVELRRQKEIYNESCYFDNSADPSKKIESILIQLNKSFDQKYIAFDQKYLCNRLCFCNKGAAIIVHEFAHLFEADIFLYSRKYMNQYNPALRLEDLSMHNKIPQFCDKLDDELIKCEDFVIVNNGILENIIVDKKWADIYHIKARGNGRIAFNDKVIVMPRIRISKMSFDSSMVNDNHTLFVDDTCLIFRNIKGAKLSPKDGMVTLSVENVEYKSLNKSIKFRPFNIKINIFKIISNIFAVSKENYYAIYPCGKNGLQLPCGIVTPKEVYILKEDDDVLLL